MWSDNHRYGPGIIITSTGIYCETTFTGVAPSIATVSVLYLLLYIHSIVMAIRVPLAVMDLFLIPMEARLWVNLHMASS